jgi:6-phosphogluconolactonase
VFDTIFLGVGDDGHTASLFPGSPALSDTTSLVLHTRSPKPPHDRITLGLRPLLCARHLVVIVAGQTKAPIMERIRRGDDSLPIVTVLAGRHESELYFEAGLGR